MKQLANLTATILFALIIACHTGTTKNDAKIAFEVTEHNFGELDLNGDGNCTFLFSNPGKTPLVISDVKTSCGCTVPEWTKEPVKPGRTGEIRINYDTSHPGRFSKTITVFYNGSESPQTLTIKGSVRYPESTDEQTNE